MENEIMIHSEEDLRSKFLTTKISSMSRSLPYVFTAQGVYMSRKSSE